MDAMEGLAQDERPLRLRPELAEAQQRMNEVQFQIHQNKRLAREAEQRKNDLVVYLAHDLKTPLTSVIGYLTLFVGITPKFGKKKTEPKTDNY